MDDPDDLWRPLPSSWWRGASLAQAVDAALYDVEDERHLFGRGRPPLRWLRLAILKALHDTPAPEVPERPEHRPVVLTGASPPVLVACLDLAANAPSPSWRRDVATMMNR